MLFFFQATVTPDIYTYGHALSLPDALPLSCDSRRAGFFMRALLAGHLQGGLFGTFGGAPVAPLDPPHEKAGDGKQRNDQARQTDQGLIDRRETAALMQAALHGEEGLAGTVVARIDQPDHSLPHGIDQPGPGRGALRPFTSP